MTTETLRRANQEQVACLNMAANVYEEIPLLSSSFVRLDPVLFKDNVSVLRKEFRQMEVN